jgi:hypothetical protein
MRTLWRNWLISVVAASMPACGDGGTGPDPAALAGTWRATKAELVSVGNPSTKVELVSQDMLSLNYAGGEWQFDMVLSGNTLTLSGADGEYDFNDDDVDDPAKVNLVLVRE